MRINVVGVGRSGTTAVGLYISTCLAHHYGSVWVNYEPYTWASRKGRYSFEGQRYLAETGMLATKDDTLSRAHQHYLARLGGQHPHVVNKFTHGIGLFHHLRRHTEPDVNVLVIRDIRGVLRSLSRMSWDFFKVFQRFIPTRRSLWSAFADRVDATGMLDGLNWGIADFDSPQRKTALYWYVTNREAILNLCPTDVIIRFESLDSVRGVVASLLDVDPSCLPQVTSECFRDRRKASDETLRRVSGGERVALATSVMNECLFATGERLRFKIPLIPARIGCKNVVTDESYSNAMTCTGRVVPGFPPVEENDQDCIVDDLAEQLELLLASLDTGRFACIPTEREIKPRPEEPL